MLILYIYQTYTWGIVGAVWDGEKEGLFVARVVGGATTQPLHYSIYPVGWGSQLQSL